MRHWPILILVAIAGCTSTQEQSPGTATAVEEHYPTVAGDVEVVVGSGREVIAPSRSATPGSKWIEHTVTYTNKSAGPIWIVGYSEAYPFSGIETRANELEDWRNYGLMYCGTGAHAFEIAPNTSHAFPASLPEKYIGQDFRVILPYRTARESQQWVQAASQAHKLGRPVAG